MKPLTILGYLIGAATISTAISATAPLPDPLEGVWVSDTPFVRPSGELLVTRDKDRWSATIGNLLATSTPDRDTVKFSFADGQTSFRGHIDRNNRIDGFWIQEGVSDQPLASPLILESVDRTHWKATVPDLGLGFTLYLQILRREDGVLIGAFRNPQINTRGGSSRFHVEHKGTTVRFLERNDGQQGIIHEATLEQNPERLKLMWPQFRRELELTRATPTQAASYFPRPQGSEYKYKAPDQSDDGWQSAHADATGLDEGALTPLVRQIAQYQPSDRQPNLIHSLLVAHKGRLVLEEYFFGHDRNTLHDMRSASKTFASVLLGSEIYRGTKISPTSRIVDLMKSRGPVASKSDMKGRITLAHLMTHTSGLACDDNDEKSPGGEEQLQTQTGESDWWKFTLDLPMRHEPGTRYAYCSAGMNLVGGALKQVSGMSLPELFDREVARPLQFGPYAWNLAPNGEGYLGGGARLRPRDLLKIGQTYLNGGVWNGRRIVSSEWIKSSTVPVVEVNETTTGLTSEDFANVYTGGADALAWHSFPITAGGRTYREYEAAGNGGQLLIVIPELDLALVMTGGNYGQGAIWTKWRDQFVASAIIPAITK
ncbi:MAG: serine hydrolase [Micropepsaceae bacterium]